MRETSRAYRLDRKASSARASGVVPARINTVYTRFGGYVPRSDGVVSALAGPKVAHFGRVEWVVIPDIATAAAALRRGEVDWWEQAHPDYWSMLCWTVSTPTAPPA